MRSQKGARNSAGTGRPNSSCVATWRYVRPSRRSRSSALTSAYRVMTHWPVGSWKKTGDSRRSRPNTGYGSATNSGDPSA
jgi:hypothetical protein